MAASERDVIIEDRTVRVREAGDPSGFPVLYFHGTPGSRLDVAFGDEIAATEGVKLLSFDRPGYGGSSLCPFGLLSLGRAALSITEQLGVDRFAALGLSGGGPFALAAAAAGGRRVTRVGVASGAGPFQEVPGALEQLSAIDTRAVGLLPDNPAEAAATFASGFVSFEVMSQGDDTVRAVFEPSLSERDRVLFADPVIGTKLIASIREGLRQGTEGAGWDNVAWVGRWEIDVAAIETPVLLWYGDEDLMAPPAHGHWLAEHLPRSQLVVRKGEGHLGLFDHFGEVLQALVAP
ncbi:MAG: alpha/beta fold hydrolase [Acidimicrobiales bacterium]|jgi:pimeloyl-ACP methyl ester carboxylesterase